MPGGHIPGETGREPECGEDFVPTGLRTLIPAWSILQISLLVRSSSSLHHTYKRKGAAIVTQECQDQSEVMRLLNQIETEYLAAQYGLTGFAEGAKHAAITARLENMGRLHEHLRTVVGDEATQLMAER